MSHCPDVPSVHHYLILPLFSWSGLYLFQFTLANTFCQTTEAQGLLCIFLGGHSNFLGLAALCSPPRPWLLCSSNTILGVAILWERLFSLGHSERTDTYALCYDIPGVVRMPMTTTTTGNVIHRMAKDIHPTQIKQQLHEIILSITLCGVLWYFLFHSISSLLMPVLSQ